MVLTFAALLLVSCDADRLPKKLRYAGDYSSVKVSFLGDSITHGIDVEHPYPELVKALLGLQDAVNLGIPGSTVSNLAGKSFYPYVERYEAIDEDSDIVVIQIQGNDGSYRVPIGEDSDVGTDTFKGALNFLIHAVQTRCPDAYIFLIGPNRVASEAVLAPYANAIADVAKQNGIDYLNLFDESASYDWRKDTSDGVHHTQRYLSEVLAPRIANYIIDHYRR